MSNFNLRDALNKWGALPIDQQMFSLFREKTCAVVGNGGIILEAENGELIDSHDIVIRCNQTPLDEYKKHTGVRTDIRMMNSHYFYSLKAGKPPSHKDFIPSMKKIHPKFDENFLYSLEDEVIIAKSGTEASHFPEEIKKIEERRNKVFFLNNQFYSGACSLVGTHATNGFVAILLGLKYFEKVNCFGFGFYKETEEKLHYYQHLNIKGDPRPSCHDNAREENLVHELIEQQRIILY